MAKNTKWILAFIFLFILIPTIGTIRGRTQADIDGTPKRGSIASDEMQRNGNSNLSMISADGRFVTFQSYASNLVNGDTNHDCVTKDGLSGVNCPDVFVYDRDTTEMRRVSVSSNGAQGNSWSAGGGTISADGRYVAFPSAASNLVSGDTNKTYDVFVHDRETGQITSVSVSSVGMQGNRYSYQPFISASGRFVAYSSAASNLVPADTNELIDIFVHDRETGETTRVSVSSTGVQGNSDSYSPSSISDDGRYVAFYSDASNLVVDDTNGCRDIFVHDRQSGQTERVSVEKGEPPALRPVSSEEDHSHSDS